LPKVIEPAEVLTRMAGAPRDVLATAVRVTGWRRIERAGLELVAG